jgi:hypothetical protein
VPAYHIPRERAFLAATQSRDASLNERAELTSVFSNERHHPVLRERGGAGRCRSRGRDGRTNNRGGQKERSIANAPAQHIATEKLKKLQPPASALS